MAAVAEEQSAVEAAVAPHFEAAIVVAKPVAAAEGRSLEWAARSGLSAFQPAAAADVVVVAAAG